jgi:Permease MlaE
VVPPQVRLPPGGELTTETTRARVAQARFGAIIAIVCCYQGMTASGGAEGVGRAVNQAVVISFLGVFAFNYVFTPNPARHPPRNHGDPVSGGVAWPAITVIR